MEGLKACPFCEGKAEIIDHGGFYTVSCTNLDCAATIDLLEPSEEAAAADWNRRTAPENKPLTLDELRRMDGEPVWINADHYGIYADVVSLIGKEDGESWVHFAINTRLHENGYGKTWIAYARRPERSNPHA